MPHYPSRNESGTEYQAWSLPPPRVEAKALFTMLGRNGDTEESLLKLIRVAPVEQAALRECAARYHELSGHIERALRFRERVEKEFEALCRVADVIGNHAGVECGQLSMQAMPGEQNQIANQVE